MEMTTEQLKSQFRIVGRNDEFPDPVVRRLRETFSARRQEGELTIRNMLDSLGLVDDSVNEETFDVRFMEEDFESHWHEIRKGIVEEGDLVKLRFINNLTFEKLAEFCCNQRERSFAALSSLADENDTETYNTAYLHANFWRKADYVLHRALSESERKLKRLSTEIPIIEEPKTHSAEIYHLPTPNSQLDWC